MTDEGVSTEGAHDWIAYLDEEMADAAAIMEAELGQDSVCTVHKDGRVTGGLKYQEGRLSALTEARRLARHSSGIEDALVAHKQKWDDELDRRRKAKLTSMPWVSYASGGADAWRSIMEAFRRMSPRP